MEKLSQKSPEIKRQFSFLPCPIISSPDQENRPQAFIDPLIEEEFMPVKGLVHKYGNRALVLLTMACAAYCRFCTRQRSVSEIEQGKIGEEDLTRMVDYLKEHREVKEVILSGGDPLVVPSVLKKALAKFSELPQIKIIRIGTRVPVSDPSLIKEDLLNAFQKVKQPLYLMIHFEHPDEITPEMRQACGRLADAGIPLGSQTVLLAGVNDSVETMTKLFHGLLTMRVRPYYLYQCDPIPGSNHFRTSVAKGLEIIRGLRGHTTGYAVPTYVVDAPGGGGKIPLLPEYVAGRDQDGLILRNYEGNVFRYPENHADAKDIH